MKYLNLIGATFSAVVIGAALWLVNHTGPSEYDPYWEQFYASQDSDCPCANCWDCPEPSCSTFPIPPGCDS